MTDDDIYYCKWEAEYWIRLSLMGAERSIRDRGRAGRVGLRNRGSRSGPIRDIVGGRDVLHRLRRRHHVGKANVVANTRKYLVTRGCLCGETRAPVNVGDARDALCYFSVSVFRGENEQQK